MNIASALFFTIASTEPRNARNCPRSVPQCNEFMETLTATAVTSFTTSGKKCLYIKYSKMLKTKI